MANSQDSSVTSTAEVLPEKPSQEVNSLLSRLLESANEKDGKNNEVPMGGDEESRLTKVFPWISQYNKLCQAEIGATNINTLENLMTIYIQNVSLSVNECYLKPNRAAKLKKNMNDTLLLFHMFYSEIKKPLEHSSYLDKMSDLLAMYIDMEIKASRRGKESLPKIASKLTSSLYIFLDRSQDHILDAILKTKYMNKNFWELCVLIFSRVLRDSPGRAVYEMTYVRYVLGYKMWKRVVRGAEERRKVMKLASMKLFPPTHFREKLKAGLLSGVLPKIPKSRKDITMFLMQAKFCIKEKTKAFLKAVADPKQQGVLSYTQLAADLDRPLFFNEDVDSSRNSNSDEQEESSGSNMLMNDIWSSMSVESGGIADHLRLASLTQVKVKKVKKKVIRCKGIATPVFKTDPADTAEKKKKKKKKEKASEEKEVEEGIAEAVVAPLVESSTPGVAEEKEKEREKEKEVVASAETIGVGSIKVEPSEVCIVGYVKPGEKEGEQVNQVDSVSGGEKETEMLDIAEEVEIESGGGEGGGVKLEPPPPQSSHVHDIFLYDDQHNFYNNDFLVEYLNNSKLHDFELDSGHEERDIYERFGENKGVNVKSRETLYPEEGGEPGYCDPVEARVHDADSNLTREANQDLIAKMIESLNDRVRYSNETKTQQPPPKPAKTLADLQAKVPIEILALGEKDKGVLKRPAAVLPPDPDGGLATPAKKSKRKSPKKQNYPISLLNEEVCILDELDKTSSWVEYRPRPRTRSMVSSSSRSDLRIKRDSYQNY